MGKVVALPIIKELFVGPLEALCVVGFCLVCTLLASSAFAGGGLITSGKIQKVNEMSEKVSRIVDLSRETKTLLTGEAAGLSFAKRFDVAKGVKLEILAKDKMLITSSFFKGLLSKVDVKASQISFKGFSTQTQCEFKRALKQL